MLTECLVVQCLMTQDELKELRNLGCQTTTILKSVACFACCLVLVLVLQLIADHDDDQQQC